jgi:hypothetical protein
LGSGHVHAGARKAIALGKEEMMRKLTVLTSTFLLVGSCLTGCGSDVREDRINDTISKLSDAADRMKAVKTEVDKAVKAFQEAKPPRRDKDFTDKDLQPAVLAAQALGWKEPNGEVKGVAGELLALRRDIQGNKEPPTQEQRDAWSLRFKDQVQKGLINLHDQQRALEQSIAAAERINPLATKALREVLHKAQEIFEDIAKQR